MQSCHRSHVECVERFCSGTLTCHSWIRCWQRGRAAMPLQPPAGPQVRSYCNAYEYGLHLLILNGNCFAIEAQLLTSGKQIRAGGSSRRHGETPDRGGFICKRYAELSSSSGPASSCLSRRLSVPGCRWAGNAPSSQYMLSMYFSAAT